MSKVAKSLYSLPTVSRFRSLLESLRMPDNPLDVFQKYTESLGDTFVFRFGGVKNAIVSSDPAVIQHVLKTNYENYPKSEVQMKRLRHFLGPGLLTLHGQTWLAQRRLIHQGGFSATKLTSMSSMMQDWLAAYMERFDRQIQQGPIDISQEMMKITFGMVSSSLFSASIRDEDVDYLSHTISDVEEFVMRQVLQPYLDPWFALSGELQKHEKMRDRCEHIIFDLVQQRRREPGSYHDLLAVLMNAVYDTGEKMTDDSIVHESMQLLVAGHETSSNALSWIFYLLAKHPECIERVREEYDRVVGNSPLHYSDLPKLECMTQVVEEALRLYPPFWALDRVATADDQIMDISVPKGTMVVVFVYGVHHSPKFWDSPEVFNPERFEKENKKKQIPFTYLPFGAGPKGCVGGNYAMLQMFIIVGWILRHYDYQLAPDQVGAVNPSVLLKPKNGIKMSFCPRKASEERP